ncbi:hypothetical protein HMPREF9163_00694 [Selenomonas sp. oral taxon 138 str. F0429]|nr:hypothetical protein HMPREF9163_00694 [Selenomonas sp. oral taxon 138 str. F0429]
MEDLPTKIGQKRCVKMAVAEFISTSLIPYLSFSCMKDTAKNCTAKNWI